MNGTLIRTDKNGTKYYQGMVVCPRCNGLGLYATGVENGRLRITPVDNGICHICNGAGQIVGKWKEYTPEYEAKLEAKRAAKREAQQKVWEAEEAQRQAERQAREEAERIAREAEEARIAAEKAISQHVGQIGDKIDITATFVRTAWFEVPSYRGFGTDTMYVHIFKDAEGNKLVWKTSTNNCGVFDDNGQWIAFEEGQQIHLKGTVKDHSEYKDEKQTVLTRCKVQA